MKKHFSIYYYLVFLIIIISASCKTEKEGLKTISQKPNILLIVADDMGYGDVGVYNPASKIPTPNIDRIASEGLMFTDAHSSDALCSPSRYGLLTGRYSWRTRLKEGVLIGYDETALIEKGRPTLANVLGKSGYATAFVGKWHMGWTWQTKDGNPLKKDENNVPYDPVLFSANEQNVDFSKPISGGPIDLGFDYFFGTFGCSTSDPPYTYIENKMTVDIPTIMSREEYTGLPGFLPGVMAPDWVIEEVDTVLTQKAIAFIQKATTESPEKPFFLTLALSAPHNPFVPPGFAIGESEEGPRGDLITVVDKVTGMVIETLKNLEIENNTLVIITSDNGPMRGGNGHQSAGQLRGYKANIWEGGHRVPFIVRWPGKTVPDRKSSEIISLTDLYSSFASLVSQDVGDFGGEDSYNVLPALYGEPIEGNNEQPRIYHSAKNVYAIRKGKWKLIQGTSGSGAGRVVMTQDSLKYTGQLYDMSVDPSEQHNLWADEPGKVTELLSVLNEIKNSNTVPPRS